MSNGKRFFSSLTRVIASVEILSDASLCSFIPIVFIIKSRSTKGFKCNPAFSFILSILRAEELICSIDISLFLTASSIALIDPTIS